MIVFTEIYFRFDGPIHCVYDFLLEFIYKCFYILYFYIFLIFIFLFIFVFGQTTFFVDNNFYVKKKLSVFNV